MKSKIYKQKDKKNYQTKSANVYIIVIINTSNKVIHVQKGVERS